MSRSGFYDWSHRLGKPDWDDDELLVHFIFEDRKGKSGARTIKMLLVRDYKVVMNLKKIRRIMKKLNLKTSIRRKKNYLIKDVGSEHKVVPNYVDQNFEVTSKDQIYSTDITYLEFGSGQRAYLSAIKDLWTKEILHFNVSKKATLDLAMEGLEVFYSNLSSETRQNLLVQSDQGCHYTSRAYRELLEQKRVLQSMSRRGNCHDNAPIESFFGILKDELDRGVCRTYEDLCKEINRAINFYNTERPQLGLKGKTPAECRGLT